MGVFVVSRLRAALLCSLAVSILHAQQPYTESEAVSVSTLPKRFARDEWRIWTSPFRPSNYDSRVVKKYVIPFVVLSAALIATDRKTGDLLPNTKDQQIWSGRVSQIGSGYSFAGISGGTYLLGKVLKDDHARETGLLGLEALGHSQLVVLALKEVTNRQRPLDQDGRGGFWEGGNSFPSGHSASSFALATVFAYEYWDHIAVPIAAYSLAGLVSASRLSARRHWLSDIAVGGSLGFLIGRSTYKRHHNPELPGSVVSQSEKFKPRIGVNGSTVVLSWQF